jgi:hypothetical protein
MMQQMRIDRKNGVYVPYISPEQYVIYKALEGYIPVEEAKKLVDDHKLFSPIFHPKYWSWSKKDFKDLKGVEEITLNGNLPAKYIKEAKRV